MSSQYTKPFPLKIEPVLIMGSRLVLEPLEEKHIPELLPLLDPEIWKWYSVQINGPEAFKKFINNILNEQIQKKSLAFAVRDKDSGELVGSSRFMNIDAGNRRVEIGSTWYSPKWQRTYVNTECKFLMLKHAFETLECVAVTFQTDMLNERSQAAIERLGARREGVLRHHRICEDGRLRDSVIYSITAAEWPQVRGRLSERR